MGLDFPIERREAHLAKVATVRAIALDKSRRFKNRDYHESDEFFKRGLFPEFTELGYLIKFH